MRIAVTGASGFVGKMLVPLLEARGHKVIVFGREAAKLALLFPGHEGHTYANPVQALDGVDAVLHLAALNNNAHAALAEFEEANVGSTIAMAEAAIAAGVARFINVSSIHALQDGPLSSYAATKKKAAEKLRALSGIEVTNIFLPAVFGESWAGKLAVLNSFPKPVANLAFGFLSAISPTVKIDRVAAFVDEAFTGSIGAHGGDVVLAENIGKNVCYVAAKRLMDFSGALFAALALGWLMVPVAIAIRLDSAGPVVFAQRRVGKNGKVFICYKLRTMRQGTAQRGTHEVSQQAITRVGTWLRRYKIDEFPQILNILKGEMSWVGPRPCLPSQTELIAERKSRGVLDMLPGITGYAQVRNIDMSDPPRLAMMDQTYGKIRSILLDVKILLATAKGGGQGDRVASVAKS